VGRTCIRFWLWWWVKGCLLGWRCLVCCGVVIR
jgi:hypothetical protein